MHCSSDVWVPYFPSSRGSCKESQSSRQSLLILKKGQGYPLRVCVIFLLLLAIHNHLRSTKERVEVRVGSTDVESAEGTNWILYTYTRTCVSTLVAKLKYYDDVYLQSEKLIISKNTFEVQVIQVFLVTVDAVIASSPAPSFLYHWFPHSACRREPCDVPSCFKHSTVIAVPKEPTITGLNDYRSVALMSAVVSSLETDAEPPEGHQRTPC